MKNEPKPLSLRQRRASGVALATLCTLALAAPGCFLFPGFGFENHGDASSDGDGDATANDTGIPWWGTGDGGIDGGRRPMGQRTFSDGTLGSACGPCGPSLICSANQGVPGGYCTRGCTSEDECGPQGHCYNTPNGALCLRRCNDDFDCRPGYQCYGPEGLRGCYPRPQPSSSACVPSYELYDRWWVRAQAGDTVEQMRLSAAGDVEYRVATVTNTSGFTRAYGQFALTCPQLTVDIARASTFPGGSASFLVMDGALYQDGDPTRAWVACPSAWTQRDGRCFP